MINKGASVTVNDTSKSANVVDLSHWFDVGKYPSPHSDIVALLVLRHQVTVHNVLINANHRARWRPAHRRQGNQRSHRGRRQRDGPVLG